MNQAQFGGWTIGSRCQATLFSIQILRSQLRRLGHILRRPETDPLRLVVFEPGTELLPRLTSTGRKRVVGRPRIDWAQTLIEIFCSFAQCSRSRMLEIVSDKSKYHFIVERLCRHSARQVHWYFIFFLFSLRNDYMALCVRERLARVSSHFGWMFRIQ